MRGFESLLLLCIATLVGTCFCTDEFWKTIQALSELGDADTRLTNFLKTGELPHASVRMGQLTGNQVVESASNAQSTAGSAVVSPFQDLYEGTSGSQQHNEPIHGLVQPQRIDLTPPGYPDSNIPRLSWSHPRVLMLGQRHTMSADGATGREAIDSASGSRQRTYPALDPALTPQSTVLPSFAMAPPSLTIEERESILVRVFGELSRFRKGFTPVVVRPFQSDKPVISNALASETFVTPRSHFRKIEPGVFVLPVGPTASSPRFANEEAGMNLGMQHVRNQLFVWRNFERQGDIGSFFQLIGAIELATTSDVAKRFEGFNVLRVTARYGSDWVYCPLKLAHKPPNVARPPYFDP